MVRPPPSSTLFPYTTLFRSLTGRTSNLPTEQLQVRGQLCAELGLRSEEHTSELQSHSDIVCRLLLEKKKNGRDSLVDILKDRGLLSESDSVQPLIGKKS